MNTQLRLHMEKADVVNKALREDVEKLTVDWSRARDELMRKESQWQMEQEVRETVGGNGERRTCSLGAAWSVPEGVNFRTWMETELFVKVSGCPYCSCWQLCPAWAVTLVLFLPAQSRFCWQVA